MNHKFSFNNIRFVIAILLVFAVITALQAHQLAHAAPSDIEVTIFAAPNLVVDSNVLSPSTQAPEVATIAARFCNTSGGTLNGVVGYIGDYNSFSPSTSTPGIYPSKTNVTIGGQLYSGTYSFSHLGGQSDAMRLMGNLAAGDCKYQYWSFTYPQTANSGTIPSWGSSVNPIDDLFLDFDVWAAENGTICNSASCNKNHTATMRNEISAMANKIEPNGNPGGQWFNTNSQTVNVGETITTNGILYRLGNVNQGFDNNGDLVPDYNAWLQPIGNSTYDPSCFRLVDTSGILTVTRGSGNPDLIIPFSHALNQANDAPLLYFTDLPTDNTDVRGLVFYTFMALGGPCNIPISPYQEVASGSDNEKFNGDYGGGGPGTIESYAPSIDFDKTGPTSATEGGAAFTYTIPFQNTGSTSMGLSLSSGLSAGFVISDTVPNGLQYVTGSAPAGNTVPSGNSFTIYYSTNSGLTWSTTEPAGNPTSSGPNNRIMIQWWLNEPLQTTQSGAVTFQAQVPSGYLTGGGDPFIENCADARLGTGTPFAEACAITMVQGNNALGDTVWSDNGTGGGVANNGLQDGAETGIANVTVTLFWDRDEDGILDDSDPQVGTTTSNGTGVYGFSNLPDARYIVLVDVLDTDIPTGYGPTTPKQYAIDLDSAGVSGTGVTNNTADFGFGPALSVDKILISSDPAYEGDEVTFRIGVTNNLPGDGTASGFCKYTIWATVAHGDNSQTPPGGNNSGAQWSNPTNALGVPDNIFASTNLDNNTDLIGLSGFNMGNQGGNITDVDLLVYVEEREALPDDDDELELHVYYNNIDIGGTGFIFVNSTTFNAPVGTQVIINQDVDNTLRTGLWTWSDFSNNLTELQVVGDNGAGTSGDIDLDAVAYVVTTDQICGGADSTITELPLDDTYDADLLSFVSADPTQTTNSTSGTPPNTVGTISWDNLGPLYAGQTKYITVNFLALDPGSQVSVNTVNTASVTGAKFGNGRDANDDSDDADVDIIPTGSINGVVYSDANNNGWQDPTGFESLGTTDFGIPNVTLSLFGCYNANPASGGTLFTDVATNQACTGQAGGSNDNWYLVATTTTSSSGSYTFDRLRMGYYYVQVSAGTLPVGATQNSEAGASATDQNGTGRTCGTCDHIWGSTTANLNPTTNFNPIGANDPLTNGNENVTNINFGYNNVPATVFGKVFTDSNGDGDQDNGEANLSGITVRLCSASPCTGGNIVATTTTNTTGQYTFTGVTPGTYFVEVAQPANTTQTADPDETGTCTTCNNQTNTFTIASGQYRGSYDFGYQPSGAFSLGDTLYRDWNGDGDQDTGEEGLPNITVYLYEDEDNDGVIDPEDAIIATTTTNANGNYSFANLADGNYIVLVETSDADYPFNHTQTDDPDGACPGATCDDQATSAAIAGANDNDNDFGYQPNGFGSIGDYAWNDLDGDGNQDAGEPALSGVTVNLYEDQDGDGIIDPEDALIETVVTDVNGLYNFTGLYPYTYIVEIAQSEFGTGQELEGLTLTSTGPAYTNNGTQVSYAVNLGDGEIYTNADFGFAEGLIGDYIWRDNNGDGTPDPSEPGISGVTIEMYAWNDDGDGIIEGGEQGALLDSTTTNGSGYYEFGSLPAGNYIVQVTPPASHTLTGDPDAYGLGSFLAPPCDPAAPANYAFCDNQYGVQLLVGQTNRNADFGYQPSAYLGDTLWIDGDNDGVRDPGEGGISFITIRLCNDAACTSIVATTTTDADGYYSFGNIPNSSYFLVPDTTDPDFPVGLTNTFDPDGTTNSSTNVTVSGGVTTVVGSCNDGTGACSLNGDFGYRFNGNNTISGTVWHDDDLGGQTGGTGDIDAGETYRYNGVTVYLWNCGTGTCTDGDEVLASVTTTDGAGDYSFNNLADGTYAVTINPNAIPLAGTTPTTPTSYLGGSDPNVVLTGGTNAIRDFGAVSSQDYGDLPTTYSNTLSSDNGARHSLGNVYLGATIDADIDGQESGTAAADNDDGVTRNGFWADGIDGASVTVNVTCPTGTCYLSAWVDWGYAGSEGGDGDFNDAGEKVLLDYSVVNGSQTIDFDVPSGVFNGAGGNRTLNVRFRLYPTSTGGLAQPTGFVTNGEVEDYQWTFAPTSITLTNLTARANAQTAILWIVLALLLSLTAFVVFKRSRQAEMAKAAIHHKD